MDALRQLYMFRQPGQGVGWAVPFLDAGIGLLLVALAAFLSVQLVGIISPGREELDE
jgi:hypothetical protein